MSARRPSNHSSTQACVAPDAGPPVHLMRASGASRGAAWLLSSVSAAALLTAMGAPAPAVAQTWNAGTGSWSVGTNWTPSTVPNSSGANATVSNGGTANVDNAFTVGTLTIGSTSSVGLLNNTSLNINGSIANAGILSINSAGNLTDLTFGSGVNTLSGGGSILLSNSANRIYGAGAGAIIDNVDNTIAGAGEIGVTGNLATLINGSKGTINASLTNALTIDSSVGVTNNGLMEATNTGGLRVLSGNVIDNTGGGLIQANGAGAHFDLVNGSTLKGGTLSTSGGGVIQTSNNGTLDGSAGAVTIAAGSTVLLPNNTTLNLLGTITNHGLISLASAGNLTDLVASSGTVTLNGGGTVSTSNSTANRIFAGSPGTVLDNVNNVISGAGEIGVNGNLTLKNESLIDANLTSALTIDASNAVQNTGTIRSSNTTAGNGGLRLLNTTIDNTGNANGGLITAIGANTHVDLQGATIKGGTVTTSAGGLVQVVTSGALDGSAAPVTVTSGSTIQVNNNTSLNLIGSVSAQGTIKLNSLGNLTDLTVAGASIVTLTGPGGVSSSDSTQNRIYGLAPGAVLDNVNSVIGGAGEIGVNGNLTLKNESLVDANLTSSLTIDSPNAVQNTGTIRSSNTTAGNGGLHVLNSTIDNTGNSNSGLVTAIGANTHIDLQNGTIKGGTITTAGGGLMQIVSTGTLDGSAAPVTVSSGSTVQVNNNNSLNLVGSVNAQGTIKLNSVGNLTDLTVAGASTVTLTGPGGISSSDSTQNRIYGLAPGAVLDNVNSVIGGAGEIGINGNLTLKNESLIDANLTSSLTIDSPNAVQNTGTLRASNTSAGNGGLRLSGTPIDNTGNSNAGLILATGANTHVDIVGNSTIFGGTLTGSGGGTFNLSSSTLDGSKTGAPITITSGTAVRLGNNQTAVINGIFNNHGTIAVNSAGNLTDLIVGAQGVVLQGGGSILLSDSTQNRIYTNSSNAVLENVDNTISGGGTIFQNASMILKNDAAGTIDATGNNGPLTIGSFSTHPVQNSGVLETTSGTGGLAIVGGTTVDNTGNSNGGRITANGAGTHVDINNSTILGGTLTGANGGVFTGVNSTLDGTTAGAPVHLVTGTKLTYGNNTTNFLVGTIDNNGTIGLTSLGNLTDLLINAGGATLTGTGSLVLSDSTQNRIYSNSANTVLDNVSNTISGAGTIFTNGGLSLVNTGIVDANGSSALSMGLNIANNAGGTLQGSGSGGLVVTGGATTNNGVVQALNGSAVTFTGSSSITNNNAGTLTGGTWRAVSTGSGATVSLVGGTITTDAATLVLDGVGSKIQAGTAGTYTDIQNSLTAIAGNGALNLLNNQSYTANTATKAIANQGQILIQGGSLTVSSLDNTNGAVLGFGKVVSTSGAQVNNGGVGVVQAQGGTLAVTTGIAGTGNANALANSTLDLSGATTGNTAGKLQLTGANASLNLGSQNIVVSNDYNNTNFGTGNSFNNHANVSGSGLILASGNTALGVTGSLLNSGTLALGNIHTGVPITSAITIANTGNAGPSLRGAVQNTGLTSGALTLAANNFGPLALGASTTETLTYNGSGAGSLTGQSFKVVTNFDNVAPQTVTVTGAAYDLASPVVSPGSIAFGNHHVGDIVAPQAVSVQNVSQGTPLFQEGLNASFGTVGTGITTNGASITNLTAGSTSGAMTVGVNTGTAGAINGTAQIALASNGATTSGLGITTLAPAAVTVTGGIYNLATANAIAGIAFGNVHQGASVSQALSVSNVAAPGSFTEGLDAQFGGSSDSRILTNGSISLLGGGATNNTAMVVSLDTTNTGNVNGTVTVNLQSNGSGTSGLGITNLGSQTPSVTAAITTGSVFGLAAASPVTPNPVDFGKVRINSAVSNQTLSITNTAANDGFHEKLDAQIGGATGAAANVAGSISLLAPQATDSTSLSVGFNTANAGAQTGSATVSLQSDGTGTSGLGITNLGSQTVNVQGSVYRLANPTLNTSSVNLAARVGGTASSTVSVTNTSPDSFTEDLKASLGAAPAGFTTGGGTQIVGAQGTNTGLSIGLNTATAGTTTGSVGVNFTSTAVAGETGAPDLALTSGTVAVTGNVYQTATASVTPSLNFGIVHVGDTVANKAVTVTNTAPVAALNDVITGSIAAVSGPFTNGGGNLGAGVAAGTGSTILTIGLNTGTAGVFNGGSATLALNSHDAQLADVALTAGPVGLSAQINNYASIGIANATLGSLTGGGSAYTLHLGTFTQGSGAIAAALDALNAAFGPADDLSLNSYSIVSGGGFGLTLNGFNALAAGSTDSDFLDIAMNTSTTGTFSETILLSGIGSNGSGWLSGLNVLDPTLTIDVTINPAGGGTGVPEPSSWLTMLAGLVGLGALKRRASRRS